MGMYCECGAEVTEDFDCPKCRVGNGDRFVFRLFVQIPAEVDTDFTDSVWKSKEAELSAMVGKPIGDRGAWVQGSFGVQSEPVTDETARVIGLTRDYWFDRMTFEQAKAAKRAIEANGWTATIREH